MEKLFIYGTLRDAKLREKLVGRDIPKGKEDKLMGFQMSSISDEGFCYPILIKKETSKEIIEGEIIEVTPVELIMLDRYEGDLYDRIEVVLKSGTKAWLYIEAE